MDDLVGKMLEKSQEPASLFMEFEFKVERYKDSYVYCFVEDFDMAFYSSRVDSLLDTKWDSIRCKGKKRLLEIYHYIKEKPEYVNYTKRFFIDADFDSNDGLMDDIYVTPCYSIENLFLFEECIIRILKTEYNIDSTNDCEKFNKCYDLFLNKHREMQESIKVFNAWYAALHDMDEWDHQGISLGNRFPKEFIKYNFNETISSNYSIEDIENKYPNLPKVDMDKFNQRLRWLEESLTTRLRGKYEMEFLFKYMKFLNEDATSKRFIYTKKRAVPNVDLERMISQFCQYVPTPKSLKSYILTGKTRNDD